MPLPFILAAGAAIISGLTAATTATVAVVSSISIGTLIAGAAGAALAIGIAKAVSEESDTYYNQNISESQKEKEKRELNEKLNREISSLKNLGASSDEIEAVLKEVEKFKASNEYFKAVKVIQDYKIVYAQRHSNDEMAKEIEKTLMELNKVRKRSNELN